MAPEPLDPEPYPLYNTTFTLHRLSPLYTGSNLSLDNTTLRQHARRFREILVGDVLRGVRVGLASESDAVSTAGALNTVTWRLLPAEEAWSPINETRLEDNDDSTVSLEPDRGMLVTVEYERSTYSAILLRDTGEDSHQPVEEGEGFQHFPLLLTKMPGSLRETFTDFLSETFDARVSVLHLSSKYVTDVFEKYISDVSTAEDGEEMEFTERSRSLKGIVRETEVFVGFDLPGGSGALKTMEIHLIREDLPRLVGRGKRVGNQENSPFMEALATYIKGHLALDLKHSRVKVVRIACGAFVLGGEGRVKLTEPSGLSDRKNPHIRATRALVDGLIRIAAGGELSVAAP